MKEPIVKLFLVARASEKLKNIEKRQYFPLKSHFFDIFDIIKLFNYFKKFFASKTFFRNVSGYFDRPNVEKTPEFNYFVIKLFFCKK